MTYTITSYAPDGSGAAVAVAGDFDIGMRFLGRLPARLEAIALGAVSDRRGDGAGASAAPDRPQSASPTARSQPFLRSLGQSPIRSSVSREFAEFWDELEPVVTCNSTPMVKRLIIAGKGISFFSKIAFIDELQRGDLVWRPFDIPALNGMKVGILVPSHRALPHVTQNFVARLARQLKQLEAVAATL